MNDIDVEIENGTYFSEAKEWYNEIFLRPAVMNAVMRFIAYVVVVITVIAIYNIHGNFPLSHKVTIIARLANTAKYYPVIRKIDDSDGIRKAVVRYLANKYIRAREVYSPDFFSQDYYFIQRSSQKDVFDSYYENLKNSTDSALVFFKQGDSVEIIPLSSEYNAEKNQISIDFNKKIVSKAKNIQENLKFKATMTFYMSQYDFNKSTTKQLDFIVTSYKVEQIQK